MPARRKQRAITTVALAFTISASIGHAGCEAVPDIQFVSDDARADAPAEGGASDASPDTAADSSSSPCGQSPPAGATCCATTWCVGDCGQTNCDLCAQKCQAGEICCAKPGTVLCKKTCQ